MTKDISAFIKNSDDFVLQNPRKAFLYSIAFKILGFASLVFITSSIYFAIPSFCFFSASLFIDHKILKNIEPLILMFLENAINHNPDKAGFYIGRIFAMIIRADPLARLCGIYRGFCYQSTL